MKDNEEFILKLHNDENRIIKMDKCGIINYKENETT